MTWPDLGADVGFLAVDLDGDRAISTGRELFGTNSQWMHGVSANGFAALALFDTAEAGGDGNGWIDAADSVWPRLLFWTDTNHNGVSEGDELHTMDAAGVQGISLDYHRSERTDQGGTMFRYFSRVVTKGSPGASAYDVYLRVGRR